MRGPSRPTGKVWTSDNIGNALAGREMSRHLRELGVAGGGPAPFDKADRSQFLSALDTMVQAALRDSRAKPAIRKRVRMSAPAPSDRPVGVAVGGFIALAAAMGIGRFVYTPILPFMADGLGLTKGEAGLIASANFLGYMLGALAAASPALAGRRRNWAIAALLLSAVSTGVDGLSSARCRSF